MNNHLIDTSALLIFMDDPAQLSGAAQDVLSDTKTRIWVSSASIFEAAVKKALKMVRLPENFLEMVAASGFDILPLSGENAWKTVRLPFHHPDPFDRLIIAQAREKNLNVITRTPIFASYGISTIQA